MISGRGRVAALSLGLAAVAGACGQAAGGAQAVAYGPPDHAAPVMLSAMDRPELGAIVTDADGFTLYRFDGDTATPSSTNCLGACAQTWRPLIPDRRMEARGVARELVGRLRRPEGTWQATLAGWPLYRYRGDARPGDVTGQGVGDAWYAVTPSGLAAEGFPGRSDH